MSIFLSKFSFDLEKDFGFKSSVTADHETLFKRGMSKNTGSNLLAPPAQIERKMSR